MNTIKKILGVVWIILAPTLVVLMFSQAFKKIGEATAGIMRTNTILQHYFNHFYSYFHWSNYFRILCCKRRIRAFAGKFR